MALIEAKDVIKKYKVGTEIITALNGVNLSIDKGEFVAILGTSGCGKSTLLNMLSGLERPTKGDIIVNGVRINKVNEKNMTKFRSKEMGFIFQQYNLIPSLTAIENVMLPLTIQGFSKKERLRRSKAILVQLGLGKRLHNKPSEMSGGQQQRVSIARSLVGNPKIIFADEPTGNLDSKTTIEILEFMQKIVREEQKTLIMVSHDLEVAMYADRIVHMLDGQITYIEIVDKEREEQLHTASLAEEAAKQETAATDKNGETDKAFAAGEAAGSVNIIKEGTEKETK